MAFMVYSILIMGTNPTVYELKKVVYICCGCLALLAILMITVKQSSAVQILGYLVAVAALIIFGLFVTDSIKITDKSSTIKTSEEIHQPRNEIAERDSLLTRLCRPRPWKNVSNFVKPQDNFFFGYTECNDWQTYRFTEVYTDSFPRISIERTFFPQ